MPRARDILLIALTAACVGAGALLPQGAALLQDRQIGRSTQTQTLDTVQLLLRQELSPARTLALLSGPCTRVPWDAATSLDRQEAADCLSGILWDMAQLGLIPASEALYGDPAGWDLEGSVCLMISQQESGGSVLLWEWVWDNPGDAVYTVWIDDATGLLCGIRRAAGPGGAAEGPSIPPEEALLLWGQLLEAHCGAYWQDADLSDWDGARGTVVLTLAFADAPRDSCAVTLDLEGTNFSFVM